MPGNAFVYGTLMAEEVVSLLLKRVPPAKPARLVGFSRYKVKGQVFPAIVPTGPQYEVSGKVRGRNWLSKFSVSTQQQHTALTVHRRCSWI